MRVRVPETCEGGSISLGPASVLRTHSARRWEIHSAKAVLAAEQEDYTSYRPTIDKRTGQLSDLLASRQALVFLDDQERTQGNHEEDSEQPSAHGKNGDLKEQPCRSPNCSPSAQLMLSFFFKITLCQFPVE